jgi:hypothetical protein
MHHEDKLLNELAEILNANRIHAAVVPAKAKGSGPVRDDGWIKGYVQVWETVPAANVYIHGMNYWMTDGSSTSETPIDCGQELVEQLTKMRDSGRY